MSNYAQIYRRELRDLDMPVYRSILRLAILLAVIMDRYPRVCSVVSWIVLFWSVCYIFMNYHFTTNI